MAAGMAKELVPPPRNGQPIDFYFKHGFVKFNQAHQDIEMPNMEESNIGWFPPSKGNLIMR